MLLYFNSVGKSYLINNRLNIIKIHTENKKHINAKIEIDVLSCLSWHQTMCFSCKDPCFYDAIDFLAMFRPTINQNCTACGLCIKSCPTGAIKIIS